MISLGLVSQAPERVGKLVLMGAGGAPIPPTKVQIKLTTFYNDATTESMAELSSYFVYDPSFFGGELKKVAAARMPRPSCSARSRIPCSSCTVAKTGSFRWPGRTTSEPTSRMRDST